MYDGLTAKEIAYNNGFGNIVTLFEQYEREQASSEKFNKILNPFFGQVEEKPALQPIPQPKPVPVVKPSPNPQPVQEKPYLALQPIPQPIPVPVVKPSPNPQPESATYSKIKAKVLYNEKKTILNLTVSNLSDLQEQIKNKLNIIEKFRIEYLDKDFGSEFVELSEITELKDLVELQISLDKENNLGTEIFPEHGIEIDTQFQEYVEATLYRVTDVEPSQILNPIIGLMDFPLCSFDETVQSLMKYVPGIEKFGFTCTMFVNTIDNNKKQNLSDDEISSINLYTRESNPRENSLYFVLNKALRDQDRNALKPYFPYLRLLLHSMYKLPRCSPGTILWRGVQMNVSSDYSKGKKIIWWGFSSCTKDMNALDTFLGKNTDRTLFNVQINSAIEISQFSAFPKEEEVLVFPCVTFEVQNVYSSGRGLWIVQLKEIFSPEMLIMDFNFL